MDLHPVDLHHQGRRGRLAPVGWRRLTGLRLRDPRLLLGLGDRPNSFGYPPHRLGRYVHAQRLLEQVSGRAEPGLDPNPTRHPREPR